MTERRIALCVGQWSSESVLYAWTYLRHCILRARSVHPGCLVALPSRALTSVSPCSGSGVRTPTSSGLIRGTSCSSFTLATRQNVAKASPREGAVCHGSLAVR